MKAGTLIIKVTRTCNFRCTYCHAWRDVSPAMSFPVLAHTIARAIEYFDEPNFCWHGGEPTILPIAFFEKAMRVQEKLKRPGQKITNSFVTNGSRLNEDWAKFLRDSRFEVGISFDGPPELHDKNRPYVNGRSSWGDVTRGMEVLRKNGVQFGALAVVDKQTVELGARRLFDSFAALGITGWCTLPAQPAGHDNHPDTYLPSFEQMSRFLIDLYDRWIEYGDPRIGIREIDAIRDRLAGRPSGVCTTSNNCCFERFFSIEPEGDIRECDCFNGEARDIFGNVMTHSLADAVSSSGCQSAIDERANDLVRIGGLCPESSICNGGCAHDRHVARLRNPGQPVNCCGHRPIIQHIRSRKADEERMIEAARSRGILESKASPELMRRETSLALLA